MNSVKLSLKKCLRNAGLNFVEFSTVLVEIEADLNSQPLKYVCDEMEGLLTPSHLIIGHRILSMPTKSTADVGRSETALTRTRFLQRFPIHFWNRCRSEYLRERRGPHQYPKKANWLWEMQVGDIVCVHERKTPR